ncbi:hypothetical protein QQ045_026471 [Rhodiola kirilowii]
MVAVTIVVVVTLKDGMVAVTIVANNHFERRHGSRVAHGVGQSYNNGKHKCLMRDGMNLRGYILDLAVLDAMLEGTTRVGSWHFTPNKHSELCGLKDIVDVVWFLDCHDNLELPVKFYVREMVNDLCI